MDSTTDRQLGRHYTPAALARRMVQAGLDALTPRGAPNSCRVLDPACGDGAFLVEAFDQLCRQCATSGHDHAQVESTGGLTPAARLEIVRESIFGVDIDPVAVDALRQALLTRIDATGKLVDEANEVVTANIRLGDALTGPGPARVRPSDGATPVGVTSISCGANAGPVIAWDRDFPSATEGFDLVVGNPPYLRECNAQALFQMISESDLGRQWREARMDLWYYFAHRGLDLLRSGGVLTFVVNSYWIASRGARRLIERLEHETQVEEIEMLGNQPIFPGVSGRHLVFRVHKVDRTVDHEGSIGGNDRESLSKLRCAGDGGARCRVVIHADVQRKSSRPGTAVPAVPAPSVCHVAHSDLFEKGRIVLVTPGRWQTLRDRSRPLGNDFDTRQGMAENPPVISRRVARDSSFSGRFTIGEGVFVLRPDEVKSLGLTPTERGLLRPYFDTERLGRYLLPDASQRYVLYLTRDTAPTLEDFPNIARHLERFRPILERRRETRLGKCAWWHLHWPRDESIFTRPRILSIQMGRRPSFVYAERPTFVGFSVNVILKRSPEAPSLVALTGVLNSTLAKEWFERHAKRRGVHLEINAGVLREFPLPAPNAEIEQSLDRLVARRQMPGRDDSLARELESEIESEVERWYGLPAPSGD